MWAQKHQTFYRFPFPFLSFPSKMSTTFRAYANSTRIATAVLLKDKTVLQVYPEKKAFLNVEAWQSALPEADRFTKSIRGITKTLHIAKPAHDRREDDFAQFLYTEYKWLITSVRRLADDKVELQLNDLSKCTVTRSLDFLEPPTICRNGCTFLGNGYTWSPELSSACWLKMLLFDAPVHKDIKYD